MILNVIKFFIGLALGILICIGLVMTCFYDVVETAKNGELPYDNVTYMIHSYHKCEVEDKGTFLECPVCGKYFYRVHTWEVDEFYGDNDGLTVAEVELADENEPFDKPEWLGEEVTGDPKYFNSMLMKNPYKNWK